MQTTISIDIPDLDVRMLIVFTGLDYDNVERVWYNSVVNLEDYAITGARNWCEVKPTQFRVAITKFTEIMIEKYGDEITEDCAEFRVLRFLVGAMCWSIAKYSEEDIEYVKIRCLGENQFNFEMLSNVTMGLYEKYRPALSVVVDNTLR